MFTHKEMSHSQSVRSLMPYKNFRYKFLEMFSENLWLSEIFQIHENNHEKFGNHNKIQYIGNRSAVHIEILLR